MWEFNAKKIGKQAQILTIEGGALKTDNEFGNIATGPNFDKLGKPILLKSVKN